MRQLTFSLIFLSMMLFCACGSSRLFFDNFDSDTVGNRPNESPPGDPVGDYVYLSNTPITGHPDPAIVISSGAIAGRSLAYSNINIPVGNRYLGFMSKEVDPSSTRYWAFWSGKLQNFTSSTSPLDIWLGTGHFLPMARLRIDDGQFMLDQGSGEDSYEPIGEVSDHTTHTVIIAIDKNTQRYNLSIIQGSGTINTGWKPVLHTRALSTLRPTLYLWFSERASSTASYIIDSMTITEKAPEE